MSLFSCLFGNPKSEYRQNAEPVVRRVSRAKKESKPNIALGHKSDGFELKPSYPIANSSMDNKAIIWSNFHPYRVYQQPVGYNCNKCLFTLLETRFMSICCEDSRCDETRFGYICLNPTKKNEHYRELKEAMQKNIIGCT